MQIMGWTLDELCLSVKLQCEYSVSIVWFLLGVICCSAKHQFHAEPGRSYLVKISLTFCLSEFLSSVMCVFYRRKTVYINGD